MTGSLAFAVVKRVRRPRFEVVALVPFGWWDLSLSMPVSLNHPGAFFLFFLGESGCGAPESPWTEWAPPSASRVHGCVFQSDVVELPSLRESGPPARPSAAYVPPECTPFLPPRLPPLCFAL